VSTIKIIYGTKDEEILVSNEDYSLLSRHKWNVNAHGYARCSIGNVDVFMHKLIQPSKVSYVIDHINRNKLDNQRENLRAIHRSQNDFNQGKPKNNTSGYLGVMYRKDRDCYYAQISINNEYFHIGSGLEKEEAAKLRDYIAWRARGEYAVFNFPDIDYNNFTHPRRKTLDERFNKWMKKSQKED
jgi:hypothetical protein